jgi:hypothetical protein
MGDAGHHGTGKHLHGQPAGLRPGFGLHDHVSTAPAYDAAAVEHYGEFACLNEPQLRQNAL